MKRFIIIFVLFLAALYGVIVIIPRLQPSESGVSIKNGHIFENEKFFIKYPVSWVVLDETTPVISFAPTALRPTEGYSIKIFDYGTGGSNKTRAEYVKSMKAVVGSGKDAHYKNYTQEDISVNGLPATKIEFDEVSGGLFSQTSHAIQIVIEDDSRSITYVIGNSHSLQDASLFSEIYNSFGFINTTHI